MRVCGEPGCPTLTPAALCPVHLAAARAASDKVRVRKYASGGPKRWRDTSRAYLLANPACTDCGARATDVHHDDNLGHDGPRGYDPTNLRALCRRCHARRTGYARGHSSRRRQP